MTAPASSRPLPPVLESLRALATDLRWTWSHTTDNLWRRLDPERWAAADPGFVADVERSVHQQRAYLARDGWFASSDLAVPVVGAYTVALRSVVVLRRTETR